jgi:acyl carrier protein
MERKELTEKVKECIKASLSDIQAVSELNDDTPLIAEDGESGVFNNSLCVLEVTSALVTEFEVDPSIFKKESFKTVSTLVSTLEEALNKK